MNGVKAASVIPVPTQVEVKENINTNSSRINFHPQQKLEGGGGGAVSGTSSESDTDYTGLEVRDLSQVRWSPKLEATLEEILIRNQFDFKATSREFQRLLNRDEGTNTTVYKIDSKTLQLRWTDIEIRRYVMPKMASQIANQSNQNESREQQHQEEEEEED